MIERSISQPHKLQSDHPLVLWTDRWKLHDKGFPAELQVLPPLVTVPQASIWPPCGTECLTGEIQDDVRLTPGLIWTLTVISHYQWTCTINYVGGTLFGIHQTFTLLPCFHLQWPLFGIFHAQFYLWPPEDQLKQLQWLAERNPLSRHEAKGLLDAESGLNTFCSMSGGWIGRG